MFYKNNSLIIIITIMFSFFNKVQANYEKNFFDLSIKNIDNKVIHLNKYKDKTILLVNVASQCGFTKQYSSLQTLYDKYKNQGLIVIGIPSNQFGGQEPGSNMKSRIFVKLISILHFLLLIKLMLKEITLIKFTNGQKKIMENLLYQNGIFIKF